MLPPLTMSLYLTMDTTTDLLFRVTKVGTCFPAQPTKPPKTICGAWRIRTILCGGIESSVTSASTARTRLVFALAARESNSGMSTLELANVRTVGNGIIFLGKNYYGPKRGANEFAIYAAPEPRESVATLVRRIGNVDAGHILCRCHKAQQAQSPQTRKSPSQSKDSGLRGAKIMR